MRLDRNSLLLYAVTDRAWSEGTTLAEQIRSALKGGATLLQLREKHLSDEEFLQEAKEIGVLCREFGVPLIINDNLDVAVKSGADGIHVGQDDMKPEEIRKIVGDDMIIGVSAQTVEQAVAAERGGADYLGVGAMFVTSTKADAKPVSFDTLRSICRAVSIPVVAIGGIGAGNMQMLSGSGIAGVALVSAIFAADDIKSACEGLCAIAQKVVEK